ncbi:MULTISPECIES: hypothetical protein [Deinococcus]|uniref:Uncharacterized protein n=1 Tax=Deinococcus rufus TaxID=2136097 RepID=A0ABV7ZBN4_9DEIO|nr:hypothetical protein [Deinococcus sp. AB2017081]WQE94035.1 hypothetical protein U2P90_11510 [Deinococcus sp. AB2017081]
MAAIQNVRLIVSDWDGTYRHDRYLEHADPPLRMNVPASGFEAGRTGWGGCLELTWQAMWATLDVQERDIVELEAMYAAYSGVWFREFAGVVVKSGNSQAPGHSNFKAVGLKKRLTEVRCDLVTLPEQDAGLSLRAVVTAATTGGDLGSAILDDPSVLPELGVIVAAFSPYGRKVSDVLDYLCAQAGATWDVDALRRVFVHLTADPPVLQLTEGTQVVPTFEDTDSEALVTGVWFGLGSRPDGTPEVEAVTAPEAAALGVAVKDVPLDPSVPAWQLAPVTGETFTNTSTEAEFIYEILSDQGAQDGGALFTLIDAAQPGTVLFRVPAHRRVDLWAQWLGMTSTVLMDVATDDGSVLEQVTRTTLDGRVTLREAYAPPRIRGDRALTYTFHLSPGAQLILYEFRPERPDTDLLTRLAAFHYVLPHRDPAVITVDGILVEGSSVIGPVTPRPMLSLMREDGSTYENTVESITTHLKLVGGVRTILRAGQREGAEARAARWLGQLALMDATQDAVRARSGA